MSEAYSLHGKINVYKILVGESKGKIPRIRPVHRWESNSKMDLEEVVFVGC
jgi:hypothetical protein